jgi:hypothetical protein
LSVILACIYLIGFQFAAVLRAREVLLEQEVHVVREDPELLVEDVEATPLLAHILRGVNGAEEVDDELHGLKGIR